MPLPPKPGKEARKIQAMFDSIADRYDLLNHVLSAGTDIAWRNLVVRETLDPSYRRILDVACGTGDLALALRRKAHPKCHVVGADFTAAMLRIATVKGAEAGGRMDWVLADGLRLPFASGTFDLVTIAFGIRNMESLEGALREFRRVLRPGGKLAILEFSQVENPLIRAVYTPYFRHVLPRIGALLSQRSAYMYLPNSVLHFPGRRELAGLMKRQGFRRVQHRALSFGIAALHIGEKPLPRPAHEQ